MRAGPAYAVLAGAAEGVAREGWRGGVCPGQMDILKSAELCCLGGGRSRKAGVVEAIRRAGAARRGRWPGLPYLGAGLMSGPPPCWLTGSRCARADYVELLLTSRGLRCGAACFSTSRIFFARAHLFRSRVVVVTFSMARATSVRWLRSAETQSVKAQWVISRFLHWNVHPDLSFLGVVRGLIAVPFMAHICLGLSSR